MLINKEEKEIETKIYESLLHPKHQWRTIDGISKYTKLSKEKVQLGLEKLIKKNDVRISYVPDIKGNDLFGLVSRVDRGIK